MKSLYQNPTELEDNGYKYALKLAFIVLTEHEKTLDTLIGQLESILNEQNNEPKEKRGQQKRLNENSVKTKV